MNTLSRSLTLVAATAVGSLVLAGCVARADQAAGDALTVTSTDDSCEISSASSASGTLNFAVTNAGSETTEFYLLASDGLGLGVDFDGEEKAPVLVTIGVGGSL